MADIESTDEFDDELLSAYVDGELDQDQRAQVEQRLREDLRAKQLVSELQSLSQTLRSLPREQVGKELREAVMQQVERERVSVASQEGSRGSTRRWVWASMAIAATLLLMVFQPQENEEEKKLAQAEPQLGREVRSAPEMRAPLEAKVEEEMVAGATFANESAVTAAMEGAEASDLDREDDELDRVAGETEELCVVYFTCPAPAAGRQRFDELLASNGIVLESESPESAGKVNVPNSPVEISAELVDELSQAEVVLVEASQSQLEGLLEDCYDDVTNLNSLSFGNQADSLLPEPYWRQYERKGGAENSNGAIASYGKAIEGLKRDVARPRSNAIEEKFTKSSTPSSARGRAARVGVDWLQSHVQTHLAKDSPGSGLGQKSKRQPAVPRRAKRSETGAEAQVRVLFVLQPEKPSEK